MNRILTAFIACLLLTGPSMAAGFDQAAKGTRQDLAAAKQELIKTQRDIATRRDSLNRKIAGLEAAIKREREIQLSLQKKLASLSREKAEAQISLHRISGDLQELAGHVRASARELLTVALKSPVTAEQPQRLGALNKLLAKGRLPGLGDLEVLLGLYFKEVRAASLIMRRQGKLVDAAGHEVMADIVRIGAFTTMYKTADASGFALPGPNPERLLAVIGDIPWGMSESISGYLSGTSARAPLDISGGAALKGMMRSPTIKDRLEAGGPLIWPILLVGLAGLILILERLIFLQRARLNTDRLMDKVIDLAGGNKIDRARGAALAVKGRPVANIILAGLNLAGHSPESVETGLSEAILKEMPRLERSITALKVLAAAAPLLGLLGTVTGMINTFQVITVHGSGDPRLMAGGISEALITTQLGLAVAIPIMMAAALLGRRAQRLASDMEAKALRLSAMLIRVGEDK